MSRRPRDDDGEGPPLAGLLASSSATADDAVLRGVVHRHRRRRARLMAATGSMSVVLAAGVALGAVLAAGGGTKPAAGPAGTPTAGLRLVRPLALSPRRPGSFDVSSATPNRLVRLFVERTRGVVVRTYREREQRDVAFAPVVAANTAPAARKLLVCRSEETLVFEVSDPSFAGQLLVPVVARRRGVLELAGAAVLGVKEGTPVTLVFAVTRTARALITVRLPNGSTVRTRAVDGVAALAVGVPPRHGLLSLGVRGGPRARSPVTFLLPAGRALAESIASCRSSGGR